MMSSTIGRTGVNVLSPVRHADSKNDADGGFSPTKPHTTHHREGSDTVRFGRSAVLWEDEEVGAKTTIERLPFPTHVAASTELHAKDDSSMKNDAGAVSSTMHYSRSQDLPTASAYSPSRSSVSPRLSPRRSPRNSPLRQSLNANKEMDTFSSSTDTWKSRGTLASDTQDRDYSNSISRSTSVVQEPATPTSHNTATSTPNSNNEELLAQLEVLKMQNKMLTTRIQRAQEESHTELEKERKQRMVAVTELTTQNQLLSAQLNDAQLQAQRQLQIEKEEFLRLMKQMQVERDQMDQRVRQAEVLAEDEQRLVRMQKAQLQDAMAQLESERDALARKLETNAVLVKELQISQISVGSSKNSGKSSQSESNKSTVESSGTDAKAMPFPTIFKFAPPCDDQLAGLQKEMSRLASSLQNIDLKKLALGEALQDTENTAAINNLQLSQQLRDEKERLELRVQKMCAEQQQMSLRLAQAEETVRTQNELAAQQMAREQKEAADALAAMSVQQQELIQNLSGSKSPSFTLNDGAVTATEPGSTKTTTAQQGTGDQTIASGQTDADRQLAQMAAAMEELRAQLQQKEQQAHERELALQEQSRLEKEELKKAVQKMKDDLRAERMLQELQYMRDSQVDVNRPHNVMGSALEGGNGFAMGSSADAAIGVTDGLVAALDSGVAAALEQNLNFSSSTPVKISSISSERSSPSFLAGTASGAARSRTGSVCSHNGSRMQIKPPAGSPSASPAHLASHKSLFDLLVADNKANNKANNNNKHKPPPKASPDGKKRDILQFNTYAVNEPQLGALQYQHESSYHKIHLTKKSMLDVTDGITDAGTGTGGGNAKGVKLGGAGKQKTIMDLDSDSDEEPWGAEPATPIIINKTAEKSKDTKKAAGAAKIREKKVTAAPKATSKEPSVAPLDAAGTPAEKINPFKSPTRTATTAAPAAATAAAPVQKNTSAGSGDIYADYSNYDLERVAGLPAPHSAAAMNDVPRLQAFARKQLSLLQSLDQAQRQPIFYAAAYGRVEAVQYLLQTLPDAGLGVQFGLQWVRGDMHGDTPLHAAASSGCAQSTELLLEALAATPCVQVDVGVQSIADLRNNMRMTPAHLASSSDCLDVLYRYKADIEALDCHQRTPLFIACAMNRESCAEYLIDCLDHAEYNATGNTQHVSAEDKLLRKDRRGDTPLHAAACNGAIECLLLLLQHGIDPRLKNLKGLKAIDLAVRNRHKKCKDILAEYHLHYCTSSEFDSVLFLATLEGHRRIAEQAQRMNPHADHGLTSPAANTSTAPPEEEYRIIQENPMEAGAHNVDTRRPSFHNPFAVSPTSSAIDLSSGLSSGPHTAMSNATDQGKKFFPSDGIASVAGTGAASGAMGASSAMTETSNALHLATQSMFSLRTNKSMRLQRFGAWIAYHDTQSASVFWYNHETSEGQWEEPAQVTVLKQQQASSVKKDIFDKTLQAKMSMRLKRFGDWIEYTTESGKTFYYNDKDGSFQWEHPLGPEHTPAANRTPTAGARNKHRDELRIIDDPAEDSVEGLVGDSAGMATHPAGGAEYTSDSHYPWKAYLDPECGSVFWYNELTHVSQWEMPEEFSAEGESAQYGNSAGYYTAEPVQTHQSQKAQRKGRVRESLDLTVSADHYVIDAQPQQPAVQGGRRSRLRSSSFDDEHDTHAVAVTDHENDLGI